MLTANMMKIITSAPSDIADFYGDQNDTVSFQADNQDIDKFVQAADLNCDTKTTVEELHSFSVGMLNALIIKKNALLSQYDLNQNSIENEIKNTQNIFNIKTKHDDESLDPNNLNNRKKNDSSFIEYIINQTVKKYCSNMNEKEKNNRIIKTMNFSIRDLRNHIAQLKQFNKETVLGQYYPPCG